MKKLILLLIVLLLLMFVLITKAETNTIIPCPKIYYTTTQSIQGNLILINLHTDSIVPLYLCDDRTVYIEYNLFFNVGHTAYYDIYVTHFIPGQPNNVPLSIENPDIYSNTYDSDMDSFYIASNLLCRSGELNITIPEYFCVQTEKFNNEFYVTTSINEINSNQLNIYSIDKKIYINSFKTISKYKIYNLIGQTISEGRADNNKFEIQTNLNLGVYLINISLSDGSDYTQKILIK